MSRFKLKVAIVAAACVLNAGLAIASSIWLYQHIYGHRSSSSNLGAGSAEYELDASHSDAESQDEDGGSGETTVSNPPDFSFSRAPMLDDESHRDDFYSEPEIGSLLAMTGSGAVDRPAFDADRRSLRSHPHQMVEAATHERATIIDNNIRNSVDINNRPTVKFYFEPEGSYMIRMSLVAHASNDEQRGTAIVLRSLGQTGHALTVFSSYDPSTSEVAWTSYGLSIFLQGFVTLWAHDRHRRCQKLSVDLPTHQSEILTVTPLPMPLLPQYLEAVV
ncbi:hypothetical protein J132_06569 [Termitomyces sp. J132]|nr:hypothetical protein H2248_010733 [Termitomyces sp. 'cryptogamus']KNZ74615.1 hypothetical protein J132_06569 [Termitomyces sp. J132]